MKIRNVWLIFLIALIISCKEKAKEVSFEKNTGITLNEFYDLLNSVYALRLDSLSSSHEKILYINAGRQVKIPYESGVPTEAEPPPPDFSKATFVLDTTKLGGFKIISKEAYMANAPKFEETNCDGFNTNIGQYMAFIHLPWYNPEDQTLMIMEFIFNCPSYYHGPISMVQRFKKVNGRWVSIY